MPSRKHQSLIDLLLAYPELVVDLVRRIVEVQWPEELDLASGPETTRILGSERIADGTVLVYLRGGGLLAAIVVEVQLRRDPEKRGAWAVYVAGTWARIGCPVMLTVFTDSRSVARWAACSVDLGGGRTVLEPIVIGPEQVPAEMSLPDAHTWPERLTLCVLMHGDEPGCFGLARTAITVARALLATNEHRSIVLADTLLDFLNERVRQTVEAQMGFGNSEHDFGTEWGKAYGRMRAKALAEGHSRGFAEGRAEALAEGHATGRFEGLAKALWTVLQGRGLEPTPIQRARIERCRSPRQLERWIARALTAETVAAVLTR